MKRFDGVAWKKEERMMSRWSFFLRLRGIFLCVALSASPLAASAQGTDAQAALAEQSSIIFTGTVSQLAATSFADVPKSAQTIVVRVDAVLKKPAAVSLKKGDSVTVEVKDPSAFQPGTQATFYTDGWIFGSGVAVKELGHGIGPAAGGTSAAAGASASSQSEISDLELRNRLNAADLVVIGRVTDVHRWIAPKYTKTTRVTEHDPDWHEAVVEVQSVLKGGQVKGKKIVVRFPGRNDVAWVRSPKFVKNQRGVFCLNKDEIAGAPTSKVGGHQVNVYTCLGHGDYLSMSDVPRVRALLSK
jgi:hypothetical protein